MPEPALGGTTPDPDFFFFLGGGWGGKAGEARTSFFLSFGLEEEGEGVENLPLGRGCRGRPRVKGEEGGRRGRAGGAESQPVPAASPAPGAEQRRGARAEPPAGPGPSAIPPLSPFPPHPFPPYPPFPLLPSPPGSPPWCKNPVTEAFTPGPPLRRS